MGWPHRGGDQVAQLRLEVKHGATRTDAAPPSRGTTVMSPATSSPLGLGVRVPSRGILMVSITTSPLFVQSFSGPLLLSLTLEELPLWEEVRSASSMGEALLGFFVVSLALTLIASHLMTLLVMGSLSSVYAALLIPQAGPSGQTGVVAPCPRTGPQPTDLDGSPGPMVGTCRAMTKGMTTRIHTAGTRGLAITSIISLRLVAIVATPPRVPQAPCSGRSRLSAHPITTASDCRCAQAWASSQGGGGRRKRRRRPKERSLAEEEPITQHAEVMDEDDGGSIGVADHLVASSSATTSMVLQKRRAEGIAVAAIGGASGFARTPIPPRPSSGREAVGVLEIALRSGSA